MLINIEFNSAAWIQVQQWAQSRIDALRLANDASLDPEQTASLRGQLKAFKELLGLPETAARVKGTESAHPGSFGGYAGLNDSAMTY